MMDQSGIALPKNGLAENKLMEGVTTRLAAKAALPFLPNSFATSGPPSKKVESV